MRIGRFATHALLSVFCSLIFVVSSLFSANAQQSLPDSPKPKIVTTPPKQASESSWPRTFASDADAFTIYQPQVDKRSEEHTSELQSRLHLVCRLLLEKKKRNDSNRQTQFTRDK